MQSDSSDRLRLSMERTYWAFCLVTTILLCHKVSRQSDVCIVIQHAGQHLLIVNDTYSGEIYNGKTCPTKPDSTKPDCSKNWIGIKCQIERPLNVISVNQSVTLTGNCSRKVANQRKSVFIWKDTNSYNIALKKDNISTLNLWIALGENMTHMPSELHRAASDPLLKTLSKDNKTVKVDPTICGENSLYNETACEGKDADIRILTITNKGESSCVTCDDPVVKPDLTIAQPPLEMDDGSISADSASEAMKNLSSVIENMGNASVAAISMGNVIGLLKKLPPRDTKDVNFGFSHSRTMSIMENTNALEREFNQSVRVSKEASQLAVNRSGTFIGVLVFPNMAQDEKRSTLLYNEVVGIDMGVEISNLTDTIDIEYRNIIKGDATLLCNSWNGQGKLPNWTTGGCRTLEINNTITCQCTHLTFFAILMSPPQANISSSDLTSLTYITYVGCGLSMFFLGVALFMQLAFNRVTMSQATKILFHLFLAMFLLNLSFLINESLAAMGTHWLCMVTGAIMHYSMLSTFTWFFIEAFHLYLHLRKLNVQIKNYMLKICITGWVIPALVVTALLATQKYGSISINQDDGNSVKMCWITDFDVHYGVNIGYYALVFLFTFIVFVQYICLIRHYKRNKTQKDGTSTTSTIMGLLFLLGITWGFAFFSFGPLTIPSYYIFSILNSFQGFFLFLYYYNTSKLIGDNKDLSNTKSSTTTSSIYVDPYLEKQ